MPSCSVSWCKNKSGSHNLSRGGISYHRFPNDPNIRAEWITATGRQNWIPGKTSTICSKHFESYDFVKKDGGRHYLHSIAVPTRNLDSSQKNLKSAHKEEPIKSLNNHVTSIEFEVMPENNIIVNSPKNSLDDNDTDTIMSSDYPRTHEEDKRIMEIMQAKIEEQELTIRKLNVRNYRLKKRLFSLKSMES